jgi:hypothetical protein
MFQNKMVPPDTGKHQEQTNTKMQEKRSETCRLTTALKKKPRRKEALREGKTYKINQRNRLNTKER